MMRTIQLNQGDDTLIFDRLVSYHMYGGLGIVVVNWYGVNFAIYKFYILTKCSNG